MSTGRDDDLKIQPKAAARAEELCAALIEASVPEPARVPTFHGGVQLEWRRGGVDLEIHVDANGDTELWCRGDLPWAATVRAILGGTA